MKVSRHQLGLGFSDLIKAPPEPPAPTTGEIDNHHAAVREQALEFAKRGWRIVPLYGIRQGNCTCSKREQCGRNSGKHPHFCVHGGLKGADNRPEEIRRWFEKHTNLNIGIRTGEQYEGPSLLAIDIDLKADGAGANGYDHLAELEAQLGALPRTPVFRTGSGGMHILLSYPRGLLISSSQGKLAHGVDVKGENSYIVAPPSRHKSAGSYEIIRFDDGPPPMIPAAWLARLRELGCVRNKSGLPTKQEVDTTRQPEPKPETPALIALPPMPSGTVFDKQNRRVIGAVGRAMLTGSGQTNAAITDLLCSLKNIPELARYCADDLIGIVRWWWANNKQHMKMAEWEQVWRRFKQSFDRWAKPRTGPHWKARDAVLARGGIEAAKRAKDPAKTLLVSIYFELQKIAGDDKEIWLSCDSGADILNSLGFDVSRKQVNRIQRELIQAGVVVIQGERVKGGWFAQRVKAITACMNEVLGRAGSVVTQACTPALLKTLGRTTRQEQAICSYGVYGEGEEAPTPASIISLEWGHAAQFMPPDLAVGF